VLDALAVDLLGVLRADRDDPVDHLVGVVDRDEHVELALVRGVHPGDQRCPLVLDGEGVPMHVVADRLDPEREKARIREHVGLVVTDPDLGDGGPRSPPAAALPRQGRRRR